MVKSNAKKEKKGTGQQKKLNCKVFWFFFRTNSMFKIHNVTPGWIINNYHFERELNWMDYMKKQR